MTRCETVSSEAAGPPPPQPTARIAAEARTASRRSHAMGETSLKGAPSSGRPPGSQARTRRGLTPHPAGVDAELDRRALARWAAAAAPLALVVYAASLGNGLVLDDAEVILENEATQDPLAWKRVLLVSSWVASDRPTTSYRPLTTWTFAVNRALHGERPLGYHLVNIVAHAGVAALVVSFAGTLGLPAATAGLAG